MIGNMSCPTDYITNELERPMFQKVYLELKNVPDRKLRSIVRAWESRSLSRKFYDYFCSVAYSDRHRKRLRYNTARDLLLGRMHWWQVDEEKLFRNQQP